MNRSLLYIIGAVVAVGLLLPFVTPVNIASFNAAGGIATKADIISRDYDSGAIRFRLLNTQGQQLAGGAVFGVTVADPNADDDTVIAAILSAIQLAK